ncbi:hypothetical protein AB7N30_17455 [Escherichia coli]|nr:hypothetical protein [Escherichia coli]
MSKLAASPIRRTTHIMKFAHRNSFDFHFFNAR